MAVKAAHNKTAPVEIDDSDRWRPDCVDANRNPICIAVHGFDTVWSTLIKGAAQIVIGAPLICDTQVHSIGRVQCLGLCDKGTDLLIKVTAVVHDV